MVKCAASRLRLLRADISTCYPAGIKGFVMLIVSVTQVCS